MREVHLISSTNEAVNNKIETACTGLFKLCAHKNWTTLPGDNNDPKTLLKLTTPVVVPCADYSIEELKVNLEEIKSFDSNLDKRHPVLFIGRPDNFDPVKSFVHSQDDIINENCGTSELTLRIEQIISRNDTIKKLARDLNEASEIALLSMSHSSELGEISRFIMESYKCKTYDELFTALFKTIESFFLDGTALVIVDDTITVQSVSGVVNADQKDTMLKYHNTRRIVDLGSKMIISYDHSSIMILDMPRDDEARCGRLADNLAVLGNCVEARVCGIDAEQKAEAASRAKTMFLATMSHELRTPMNSVIGYTGRLMKKLDGRLSEKEAKQLDAISRNGKHLLHLINDILDMSKIEVGQMEVHFEHVNIAQLLKDVFDQLSPIAYNQQLDFNLELSAATCMSEVDPKRFTQIVMNLVSNAIKYTKKGGVTLSLNEHNDNQIGESIGIAIADTGIGISEDDQKRLFGNFVQIDSALTRTVEGSGLGLAISAFFAKSHGGRIDVKSTGGEGSCFTLLIPKSPSL
jgi:signal transduction histidine kinase